LQIEIEIQENLQIIPFYSVHHGVDDENCGSFAIRFSIGTLLNFSLGEFDEQSEGA
jgi:hypothetical protein